VAVDYESPVETIEDLLDGQFMLAIPKQTRLPHIFKDSPIDNMRKCFQECVLDKEGLYDK